jgi:hypothetical protein
MPPSPGLEAQAVTVVYDQPHSSRSLAFVGAALLRNMVAEALMSVPESRGASEQVTHHISIAQPCSFLHRDLRFRSPVSDR